MSYYGDDDLFLGEPGPRESDGALDFDFDDMPQGQHLGGGRFIGDEDMDDEGETGLEMETGGEMETGPEMEAEMGVGSFWEPPAGSGGAHVINLEDAVASQVREFPQPHCPEGKLAWSFAFGFTLQTPLILSRAEAGAPDATKQGPALDAAQRIHVLLDGHVLTENNDGTVTNYTIPEQVRTDIAAGSTVLIAVAYATQHVVLRGLVQTKPAQPGAEPSRAPANDYLFPGEPVYICFTRGDDQMAIDGTVTFYTHGTDGPMEAVIAALAKASVNLPDVAQFINTFYSGDAGEIRQAWTTVRGKILAARERAQVAQGAVRGPHGLGGTEYAELAATMENLNTDVGDEPWWIKQTTFHSALSSCFRWERNQTSMTAALIVAIPSVEWATLTVPDQRAHGVATHLAALLRYALTSSNVARQVTTDKLKFILRPAAGRPLDNGLRADFIDKFSRMSLEDKLAFVRNGAPTSLYGGLGLFKFPAAWEAGDKPVDTPAIGIGGVVQRVHAARHPVMRYLDSKPTDAQAISSDGTKNAVFGIPQLALMPAKTEVEFTAQSALGPADPVSVHTGDFSVPPPAPLGTATPQQVDALRRIASRPRDPADPADALNAVLQYLKGGKPPIFGDDFVDNLQQGLASAGYPDDPIFAAEVYSAVTEGISRGKDKQRGREKTLHRLGLTPRAGGGWAPISVGGGKRRAR